MTEPTELERVAHLGYLDELVGLREGWEKLAYKRKGKDEPAEVTKARAPIAGAMVGGGAGAGIAGGAADLKQQGQQAKQTAAVQKQEKYVKRLQKGLTHATKQKQPGIAPTVAVQNLPKQRKELRVARAALKRLKGMPAPTAKGLAWKIPVGIGLGGLAGGAVAREARKRMQAE